MALSKTAGKLLKEIYGGGCGLYADNIVDAAELIRAGYAEAEDGDEGRITLYVTEKGRRENDGYT